METKNNNIFRRVLAALLASMMVLSMTACGDRTTPSDDESSDSSDTSISNPLEEPSFDEPEEPKQDTLDKLSAAYNKNNDVVGWLSLPNTKIDEPVVQGADNMFYERLNPVKQYYWYGCYYADAGNTFGNRNDLSRNTVIYGHNMHNTTDTSDPVNAPAKFGELQKYVDFDGDGMVSFNDDKDTATNVSFAKENPFLYFSTADDDMVWVVYAAYFTDLSFQYHLENPDDTVFTAMVKEGKERSRLNYNVDVRPGDKILTLSTCAYKYDNARRDQRFVVQARLLRAGETVESIKSSLTVSKNASPKEPSFDS